mgnify:FL=1
MKTFRLSSNEIKILTDMKGGCIASDRITVDGDFLLGMKARNI